MNEAECYVYVAGRPHLLLADTVQRLGINRRTAYRWRDAGKLTHNRYRGLVCCPVDEVIRLEVEKEATNARS